MHICVLLWSSLHPFIHSFISSLICGIFCESPLSESGTPPVSGDVTMSKTKFLLLWSLHVVAGVEGKRGKTDRQMYMSGEGATEKSRMRAMERVCWFGACRGLIIFHAMSEKVTLSRALEKETSECVVFEKNDIQGSTASVNRGRSRWGGFRKGKEIRGPGRRWARTDLMESHTVAASKSEGVTGGFWAVGWQELTFFLKDHCAQNGPWVRLEQGEWEESHGLTSQAGERVRLRLDFEGRACKLCWWVNIKSPSSHGYDRRVMGDLRS